MRVDVGLHGVLAGSSRGDLSVGLIDTGERALDPCILELALTPIVLERGLRRVDRGGSLRDVRAIVVVRQQHQLVAFANLLVIVDLTSRTSPATFVLRGVRSRRTYASFVTCSTRPPSHAFQLRVIVSAMASAITTMSTGVPKRSQAAFNGLGVCSICGRGAATIGVVAISRSSVRRRSTMPFPRRLAQRSRARGRASAL